MGHLAARSLYGALSDRPLVEIAAVDLTLPVKMTPTDARAFALSVLEAAEASEQDAITYRFAHRVCGASIEDSARMMRELRQLRAERAKEDDKPEQFHERG